ncbi:hypothetical protein PVAND_016715 [Polypedilum vanderplanki]|uniref:Uncharacterized protein n=1 Tax=Polypedilum vanderplanki TaxID=319348 RepID=A0A9J6BG86_POLVA|nr:hypothetical protein PVAND_016715 [Polypedilum vanderplanki]
MNTSIKVNAYFVLIFLARVSSQQMMQPPNQVMQQSQMGNHGMQMDNQNRHQQKPEMEPEDDQNEGTIQVTQEQMNKMTVECEATIKNYIRPSLCCHYPVMTIENTSAMVCVTECNHLQHKGDCQASCMFRELKLIDVNYAMVLESWKEFFLRGLDRDNVPRGKWTEVVHSSVQTCIKFMEFSNQHFDVSRKPKTYYNMIIRCILRENFNKCVEFKNTEGCMKIKNFLSDPLSCYNRLDKYMMLNVMWDYKDT